jgi:hypothetical protein
MHTCNVDVDAKLSDGKLVALDENGKLSKLSVRVDRKGLLVQDERARARPGNCGEHARLDGLAFLKSGRKSDRACAQ